MSASTRATLIGLPPELRLILYDYVFKLKTDCSPCQRFMIRGSTAKPTRDYTPFEVPWRNLLVTCRTTAIEMRARMCTATFLNENKNRTYVLDMHIGPKGRQPDKFAWKSIPCAPRHAEFLVLNIIAGGSNIRMYRKSGSLKVEDCMVESTYETLNRIIHCGPRMHIKHPLGEHLRLSQVHIIFRDDAYAGDGASGFAPVGINQGFCRAALYETAMFVYQMFTYDYFAPYFKRIKLQYDQTQYDYTTSGERLPLRMRPWRFAKMIPIDLLSRWVWSAGGRRWGGGKHNPFN